MNANEPDFFPPSFAAGLSDRNLGSVVVVAGVVGRFLADTEAAVGALAHGELDPDGFVAAQAQRIRDAADVFAGRNPRYIPLDGWNGISLNGRLQADLGDYWSRRRANWGDDACAVFFEWLTTVLVDRWKLADGDDVLLASAMRPIAEQAVNKLTGSERRAT
jgi:hypothetical protein